MHSPRVCFLRGAHCTGKPSRPPRLAATLVGLALGVSALGTLTVAGAAGAADTGRPHARTASSQTYVKEEATLHLSSKSGGATLVEQGTAHGTFSASIQIDLSIKSKVTGSFLAYLKGGSISGYASATPHFSGTKYVSFKGSLTIKHGSGKYSGASGTAAFYGAINREDDVLNVQVIGRLHL